MHHHLATAILYNILRYLGGYAPESLLMELKASIFWPHWHSSSCLRLPPGGFSLSSPFAPQMLNSNLIISPPLLSPPPFSMFFLSSFLLFLYANDASLTHSLSTGRQGAADATTVGWPVTQSSQDRQSVSQPASSQV